MTERSGQHSNAFAVMTPEQATSASTVGFFDACREVQGDRPFPRWADFKLHNLPNDMLPYLGVVDVQGAAPDCDYVYRYWGTGHTKLKGVDLTGKQVADIPSDELARIGQQEYDMVMARRAPLVFVHGLTGYGSWKQEIQVAARVPFSEDGRTIDKVVSYSNYQEDRDHWADIYRSAVGGSASA